MNFPRSFWPLRFGQAIPIQRHKHQVKRGGYFSLHQPAALPTSPKREAAPYSLFLVITTCDGRRLCHPYVSTAASSGGRRLSRLPPVLCLPLKPCPSLRCPRFVTSALTLLNPPHQTAGACHLLQGHDIIKVLPSTRFPRVRAHITYRKIISRQLVERM